MKVLLVLVTMLFITACDKAGDADSTKERAKAEQEAGNDVENSNLAAKAKKMEADLSARHHFYSAIEGQYQGDVSVDGEKYSIKFNILRSIPAYTGDRVRQLSEIETDLNNLYFHIQVVQWHPEDSSSAVGCRISQIRPNMDKGTLAIASNDCPNLYSLFLSSKVNSENLTVEEMAKSIAISIRSQNIHSVEAITGTVQPSSNANTYSFSAKKIN